MASAEEKTDEKKTTSTKTLGRKRATSGTEYEPHNHGSDEKKKCVNCNPTRPAPNDILERAMHFDVNSKGRKCTDCYCCVLYIVFLALWVGVAGIAAHFGNVYSLVYGRDYQDNICGVYNPTNVYKFWETPDVKWGLDHKTNFLGKKYLYYPRLNDDLIDYAISIGTQVKDLDVLNMDLESLLNITLLGVCVDKCPTFGTVVCTNDYELSLHQEYKDKHDKECDPNVDGQCKPPARDVGKCRGGELFFGLVKNPYYYLNQKLCTNCWVVPLNATEIFYRCLEVIYKKDTNQEKCLWPANEKEVDGKIVPLLPTDDGYIKASDDACITKEVLDDSYAQRPAYDNPVAEMLGDTLMTLQGWIRDIANARLVILVCGCLATIALGFLWILLLRWLTKPIVWGTITTFLLVLFVGAVWAYLNSGWFESAILATWLADQFHTMGISHPILDYIVTSLNTTGTQGNLTAPVIPDNPITQVIGNSLPYDLDSAGAIPVTTLWQIGAVTCTVLFVAGVVAVIILAKKNCHCHR